MSSDSDCLFCKIVAGEIPCFRLFEDDDTLAFMDINPANEGHALVIPKEHSPDVHGISERAISATVVTAKRIASAIDKTLSPGGLNLLQCNGPAAAQSVRPSYPSASRLSSSPSARCASSSTTRMRGRPSVVVTFNRSSSLRDRGR